MPDLSAALTARMNYLTARQGIIAGNIANVDTPDYLPKDLAFQPYVAAAMGEMQPRRTNARHLGGGAVGGVSGKIVSGEAFVQHNGNGVRLDMEMLNMQQTQLDYRMMTQIYAKQVSLQKMALGAR